MAAPLRLRLPRATPAASHHLQRPRLICAITCATQPLTLLADRWDCALFLDPAGDIWVVPALPDGAWAWENAGEVDSRSEFYEASVTIEHLLRTAAHVLAHTRS